MINQELQTNINLLLKLYGSEMLRGAVMQAETEALSAEVSALSDEEVLAEHNSFLARWDIKISPTQRSIRIAREVDERFGYENKP